MEKNRFTDLLVNYSECSEDEALYVVSLKDTFPFSQVLHALAARVSKDHRLPGYEQVLQSSAVYAADRAVLKSIMSGDPIRAGAPILPVEPKESPAQAAGNNSVDAQITASRQNVLPNPATTVTVSRPSRLAVTESGSGEDIASTSVATEVLPYSVADEVMDDLERLHQLKDNFEAMYEATQAGKTWENIDPRHVDVIVQDDQSAQKSRRERIIELAKALDTDQKEPSQEAETPKAFVVRKRGVIAPTIIDEIINGKEELAPDSPKQKEQLQMIDQFIKTQPTISNKDKQIPAPEGDLATIKTGEFTDNIVSETLVEILVKQGKKDKAIEVLKKLIWKFPQKKSYFAAQIEDLKK